MCRLARAARHAPPQGGPRARAAPRKHRPDAASSTLATRWARHAIIVLLRGAVVIVGRGCRVPRAVGNKRKCLCEKCLGQKYDFMNY